jgi:hypothetical protein
MRTNLALMLITTGLLTAVAIAEGDRSCWISSCTTYVLVYVSIPILTSVAAVAFERLALRRDHSWIGKTLVVLATSLAWGVIHTLLTNREGQDLVEPLVGVFIIFIVLSGPLAMLLSWITARLSTRRRRPGLQLPPGSEADRSS